ncbi:MAG: DUF948 domain-containing protein [Cyanobacteriota bacterium ELA615]
MTEPLFWLGLSLLLVSISLSAALFMSIPALTELARAARSAEKLFDTLKEELPSTLEAIRLGGKEITELTDEINIGVKKATQVVKQMDEGLVHFKEQGSSLAKGTDRLFIGIKAAWQRWNLNDPS